MYIGTPALTSRGLLEADFAQIAEFFDEGVKLALKIKAAEPKGWFSNIISNYYLLESFDILNLGFQIL